MKRLQNYVKRQNIDSIHETRKAIKPARYVHKIDKMDFSETKDFTKYYMHVGPVVLQKFPEKVFSNIL